ncbi:MAG: glycosyltransferase family 39 protein [Parvularculaceae bacterium]
MSAGAMKRDIVGDIGAQAALAFLAIIAIAILVRAIGLGSSLWYDEIATLLGFVRLPFGELVSNFSTLNNHPLYSLTAKLSVAVFGESAASLRLPAALFGVAAIAAFLPVARRALGLWPALLTILLLAVSYHQVWFSQNARGYTMLLFWTTLSTILFLEGARRNDARIWAAYGAVFAAAMYTHLSAGFYFAAHGVIYAAFLLNRFIRKQGASAPLAGAYPFFGMAFGVALTLLVYAPMLGDMGSTFAGVKEAAPNAPLAKWSDPVFVLQNLFNQFLALGSFMALALPAAIAFALYGVYAIWKKDRILAAIYLLQIPITVAALEIADMRLWPRYFFVEISFLYLAVVAGVEAAAVAIGPLVEKRVRIAGVRDKLMILAAIAMVGGSVPLLLRNYAAPKQDLAGAVAMVDREAASNDLTTVYGVAAEPVIGYFAPEWSELTPAMIREMNGDRRIWSLVAFREQVAAADPDAWALFNEKFSLHAQLPGTLGGGAVFIYVSKPS